MTKKKTAAKSLKNGEKANKETFAIGKSLNPLSETESYCICNEPYSPHQFYIGCDICERWYHGKCVKITEQFSEFIDKYYCFKCIDVKTPTKGKYVLKNHTINNNEVYIKPLNDEDPNIYYSFNPNKNAATQRQKSLQKTKWKERGQQISKLNALLSDEIKEKEKLEKNKKKITEKIKNLKTKITKKIQFLKSQKEKENKEIIQPDKRKRGRPPIKNVKKTTRKSRHSAKTEASKKAHSLKLFSKLKKLKIENEKSSKLSSNLSLTGLEKIEDEIIKAEEELKKTEENFSEFENKIFKCNKSISELKLKISSFETIPTAKTLRNLNKEAEKSLRKIAESEASSKSSNINQYSAYSPTKKPDILRLKNGCQNIPNLRKNGQNLKKSVENAKNGQNLQNGENKEQNLEKNEKNEKNNSNNTKNENKKNTENIENNENTENLIKNVQNQSKNDQNRSKIIQKQSKPPLKEHLAKFFPPKTASAPLKSKNFSPPPPKTINSNTANTTNIDIFKLGEMGQKMAAPRQSRLRQRQSAEENDKALQQVQIRIDKTRAMALEKLKQVEGMTVKMAKAIEEKTFWATAFQCRFWFENADFVSYKHFEKSSEYTEKNEGLTAQEGTKSNLYTRYINRVLTRLSNFVFLRKELIEQEFKFENIVTFSTKKIIEIEKRGKCRQKSLDHLKRIFGAEKGTILENVIFNKTGKKNMKEYAIRTRRVILNIKDNKTLIESVIKGEISLENISEMSALQLKPKKSYTLSETYRKEIMKEVVRENPIADTYRKKLKLQNKLPQEDAVDSEEVQKLSIDFSSIKQLTTTLKSPPSISGSSEILNKSNDTKLNIELNDKLDDKLKVELINENKNKNEIKQKYQKFAKNDQKITNNDRKMSENVQKKSENEQKRISLPDLPKFSHKKLENKVIATPSIPSPIPPATPLIEKATIPIKNTQNTKLDVEFHYKPSKREIIDKAPPQSHYEKSVLESDLYKDPSNFVYPNRVIWRGAFDAYVKLKIVSLNQTFVKFFQIGGPKVAKIPISESRMLTMVGRMDVDKTIEYLHNMVNSEILRHVPVAFEIRPENENKLSDYIKFCKYFKAVMRCPVISNAEKEFVLYIVPPDLKEFDSEIETMRKLFKCSPPEGCLWGFATFNSEKLYRKYSQNEPADFEVDFQYKSDARRLKPQPPSFSAALPGQNYIQRRDFSQNNSNFAKNIPINHNFGQYNPNFAKNPQKNPNFGQNSQKNPNFGQNFQKNPNFGQNGQIYLQKDKNDQNDDNWYNREKINREKKSQNYQSFDKNFNKKSQNYQNFNKKSQNYQNFDKKSQNYQNFDKKSQNYQNFDKNFNKISQNYQNFDNLMRGHFAGKNNGRGRNLGIQKRRIEDPRNKSREKKDFEKRNEKFNEKNERKREEKWLYKKGEKKERKKERDGCNGFDDNFATFE